VFEVPVMLLKRTNAPFAVFRSTLVLLKSAPAPVAVFSSAMFEKSAPAPMAVLKLLVVLVRSETKSTAVLYPPLERLSRALCPSAVLPPG
jgi:hypothetical protein